MKIFIIAGEDSGDKLGSAIIDGLNNILDTPPIYVGIGGNGMKSRGLKSIFPMKKGLNIEKSICVFLCLTSRFCILLVLVHGQGLVLFFQ